MPEHGFAFSVTFRLPAKADQKVAEHAIVALDGVGFHLRLNVLLRGHKILIRLPGVRHDLGDVRTFACLPELLPC